MEADRIKWNSKYREKTPRQVVAKLLSQHSRPCKGGRALDIACGTGRHAMFLAGLGYQVDAVDISDVALARIKGKSDKIRTILADLDDYQIQPAHYDLIINFNFLQRHLFPQIIAGLKPGGMVIFQSYLREPDAPLKAPHHQDYLLLPNELPEAFQSLHILHYREEATRGPGQKYPQVASLVAINESQTEPSKRREEHP